MAFIHRFGSSLKTHLHAHCVAIDGVFDSATAGEIIFIAATWLDATPSPTTRADRRVMA